MIQKASEKHHEKILDYLKAEKAINLFIIGDIENFGYETDFQEVWADIGEGETINGVMLRYYGNYLPYAKGTMDAKAFAEIISQDSEMEMVSGKEEILKQFEPFLSYKSKKELYFAELVSADFDDETANSEQMFKATLKDVDEIIDMRKGIEEFQISEAARRNLVQELKTDTGRTYFLRRAGKITASASTAAENSYSAMVVGVCTHREFRQQGLASMCTAALCKDVLMEGKSLCLFYDNPKAGSIYKRIGFKDIGMWSMYIR